MFEFRSAVAARAARGRRERLRACTPVLGFDICVVHKKRAWDTLPEAGVGRVHPRPRRTALSLLSSAPLSVGSALCRLTPTLTKAVRT